MATLTAASNYLEDKLLDLVFRGTTFTPSASVYLGLFTAAPSDSGGGTEVGSRQVVTFAAASSRSAVSSADVTFTSVPAGSVTHVGIFDAATSGNLLFWGEVDTPVDPDGDDLVVEAGDLTVALAYGSSSGISEALANLLLDHVLRSESYTPSATVQASLWTASGEVSGGGYSRKVTSWGAAASGAVETDAAVEWTNMPAVTVAEVRAYGSSGGPHLWSWVLSSPKAFTAGSAATIGVGGLTATID